MKNVCIVGYGAIGPVHAKALEMAEQAVLYAVCDIDAERRKICCQEYAVKEFDDFDQMLLDNSIHSVHICTPHYLHFDMIKKALIAGKMVVVEKPITMTREEYEKLLQLEGAEQICVVMQNRLNPCVQELKNIVRRGDLGAVVAAKAILTWHRDAAYYKRGQWRGKKATEGGGLLINQAIHTLDFFPYIIDDIVSVKANMSNFSLEHIIEVEDTVSAYLQLANETKGIFFATNAYEQNSAPFFEVVFERGIARYMDKRLWVNGQLVVEDVVQTVGKSYWGGGHAELIKKFYDKGKYFNIYDVKNTMEAVFTMYDSQK